MSPTLETRKPVTTLTLTDLDAFPIWEYAIDEEDVEGQDETWVRPVDARGVPWRSCAIAAADFRLSCGREYRGSIDVSRLDDRPEFHEGAIHDADGIRFRLVPNPKFAFFDQAMSDLLNGLGLTESEVFPITYILRVPFEGEAGCRWGILRGRKTKAREIRHEDERQMTFW